VVELKLEPNELTAVIEGLHDGILRRLRWTSIKHPQYSTWRTLDIETVQIVLDNFVSAYSKALMLYREAPFEKSPTFNDKFMLPDEVWDLLNGVTVASSWDDVPTHDIHTKDCTVCGLIQGVP
jgi:hypothetical protein